MRFLQCDPEHYSIASSFSTKNILWFFFFNKQKANLGSSSVEGLLFRSDQLPLISFWMHESEPL